MLSKIRKNLRTFSILLWIAAASFVGTIFLVWGRGSISGISRNEVAKVDGKPISLIDFNKECDQIENQLQQKFGGNYRKFFTDREIKISALQRLITRQILLNEAQKEGIKVSNWAVAERVRSFPVFQKNGNFSQDLYMEFLKANRLSPQIFENMIRENLKIEKLMAVINNAPSVTEFELHDLYRKEFGKRKFNYKLFLSRDFRPQVNSKEVETFYKKHINQFQEETGEQYFLIDIPKNGKDAEKLARKAYNFVKNGNLKGLNSFKPQMVTDKKLISENFRGKAFGFYSDENNYYIFFKKQGKRAKPLNEVKKNIENTIREEKALQMAREAAEKFLKNGSNAFETTELTGREGFFKQFKPVNPDDVESLFIEAKGKKFLIALENGFGVFEPITDLSVKEVDKKKEKELKEFILNAKRNSNYENFINLLRQKAEIKINKNFLK